MPGDPYHPLHADVPCRLTSPSGVNCSGFGGCSECRPKTANLARSLRLGPRQNSKKWYRLVSRVIERVGHQRCCWCDGLTVIGGSGPDRATIEHLVPASLGGTDDLENLALACFECNHARGNAERPPAEFLSKKLEKSRSRHAPKAPPRGKVQVFEREWASWMGLQVASIEPKEKPRTWLDELADEVLVFEP
jgi:5-methylcytosine-specific restriction endonuclease McrA